jgi:hypothetical protein
MADGDAFDASSVSDSRFDSAISRQPSAMSH